MVAPNRGTARVWATFAWQRAERGRGHSLSKLLSRGATLDAQRAFDVLLPVLQTLGRAHAAGVVHGCIAPEYVWIDQSGTARVSATLVAPKRPRAGASSAPSTVADDIAACGALLVAALWGPAPRGQRDRLLLPQFDRRQLRDARGLVFTPVIARALEPEPAARYADVANLERALRAAAAAAGLAPPSAAFVQLDRTAALGSPRCPSTITSLTASATYRDLAPAPYAASAAIVGLDNPLLARFELLRWLGAGNAGVVYEAYDANTKQRVALKLLQRWEPSSLARFKREFRALVEVAHPNLVAMHELFVDDEQRGFFTMELVSGVSFTDFVRAGDGGPADVSRIGRCLEQLTRGLQCLHALGKLHCDLKPSNVLVDGAGGLTIVDFGLVRAVDDRHETRGLRRSFEGTPAYAAPEQYTEVGVSAASDWYAVGVMLYEALCGRRPFEGEAAAVLNAKNMRDPAAPSQLTAEEVPAQLEALCLRLLARDPRQRADGDDILKALGRPRDSEPRQAALRCCGRERELDELRTSFEYARAGRLRATCIRGSSGIGKTLTAQRCLDTLQREGALILSGRCFVHEAVHHNAFDAIVDDLAQHVRSLPAQLRERSLPRDLAVLAHMFPVLGSLAAEPHAQRCRAIATGAGRAHEHDSQRRAFAALRELLGQLAQLAPVVLFIDDLQWSDADSVRLLHELMTSDASGLWILATYRTDTQPSTPAIIDLLRDARAAGVLRDLELGPLAAPAVMELALALLGPDACVEAADVAQKSAGHPLFARELIRHTLAHGRLSDLSNVELEAAFHSRLAMLSAPARDVLDMLCVAGHPLPRSLLFDVVPAARMNTLRELRMASAVRDSTATRELQLEPYHDRLGDFVVARMAAPRKQTLHGMLVDGLLALGDVHLEQAVRHCVLAGREDELATLAERAAGQAGQRYAFQTAADLMQLALRHAQSLAEAQRLRLAAAEAAGRAGLSLVAAQLLEQAALAARPDQRMHLQLSAAEQYFVSGRREQGRKLLTPLAAGMGMPLEVGRISMLRVVVSLLIMLVTGAPWLRRPRRDPTAALGLDAGGQALRRMWAFTPALLIVDPELACRVAEQAFVMAARRGDRSVYGQALSFHIAVFSFLFGRPLSLVERGFARARRLVEPDGGVWERACVRVMQACSMLIQAEPQRAVDLSLDIASAPELQTAFAASVRTCARGVALPAMYWTGRIARLSELVEAWGHDAYLSGDRHLEVSCKVIGAHGHLRSDDLARARADIQSAREVPLDYLHNVFSDPWWHANVAMYAGEPQAALDICADMLTAFRARSAHSAPARNMWDLTEGTCAAALAARGIDRDVALARLERSARAARLSRARGATAIAEQLAATLALQRGERRRSVESLKRAASAYLVSGMRLHAASLELSIARLAPRQLAHERSALAVFAEEGIARPDRWAYMRAPGLGIEWS